MQKPMNYCPDCGARMRFAIPPGDDRKRNICTVCNSIFYDNPRNIVGCVAEHAGRILLCKRAIEPRFGFWTLPAGFLELGESTAAGAARETREEACTEAEIDALFSMIDVPDIGQLHLYYRARLATADYAPGVESLAVALVAEQDIPWRQLAFPTVYRTLELFCADRAAGHFRLHDEVLHKNAWQRMRLDPQPRPVKLAD